MQFKFQTKNKIVAIEKGKILGYVTFDYADDVSGKRNLEISYVYVSPKHRRKGIAIQMLEMIIEKFKNRVVWISLWTGIEAEEEGSWKLYKKIGFKELAIQKDYYKKGIGTRLFGKKFR